MKKQRHHFVPQFYLRHWYAPCEEGFWLYSRNRVGKIEPKQRSARSIGFIDNLYSIVPDGLNFRTDVSHEIESAFFAPLADAASRVQAKMVSHGLGALTEEDRRLWARFVVSLMERTPRKIRELEAADEGGFAEAIANLERASPGSTQTPGMRAVLARVDPVAAGRNLAHSLLTDFVVYPSFIEDLTSMQWLLVEIPAGRGEHFLAGDDPLIVNGGCGGRPIHLLALAISPHRLLVMHRDVPAFDDDFVARLALCQGALVVPQAQRYVVSSRSLLDADHVKYARILDQLLQPR